MYTRYLGERAHDAGARARQSLRSAGRLVPRQAGVRRVRAARLRGGRERACAQSESPRYSLHDVV